MPLMNHSFKILESKAKSDINKIASLDIIKGVYTFIDYPTIAQVFKEYPELKCQKQELIKLWCYFQSLSQQELAEIVIDSIHEIF